MPANRKDSHRTSDSSTSKSRTPRAQVAQETAYEELPELIDEMKNQITPILGQINRVMADINHPDSDFRKSALAARTLTHGDDDGFHGTRRSNYANTG